VSREHPLVRAARSFSGFLREPSYRWSGAPLGPAHGCSWCVTHESPRIEGGRASARLPRTASAERARGWYERSGKQRRRLRGLLRCEESAPAEARSTAVEEQGLDNRQPHRRRTGDQEIRCLQDDLAQTAQRTPRRPAEWHPPTPALGRRFERDVRSETQAHSDAGAFVFGISPRAQPREARSADAQAPILLLSSQNWRGFSCSPILL
jgi:hypothetical protein